MLSSILNDPVKNSILVASLWDEDLLPNDARSTWTNGNVPMPGVIGPEKEVPTPTLFILINSSSILIISSTKTDEIPLSENILLEAPILPLLLVRVCVKFLTDIGSCINPSIVIIDFSILLDIVNLWAFPSPKPVNVTAVPALVVDIWKVFSPVLIQNTLPTSVKTVFIPADAFLYTRDDVPTPTTVESGLYTNSSSFLKKWSFIVNIPVVAANETELGLKVLLKIGILFEFNSKSVLLILTPLIALKNFKSIDSLIEPYSKSFATFWVSFKL